MAGRGRSWILIGVATFICARSEAQPNAAALIERYQNEPVFWRQLEIGKEIVALQDPSVLPALKPLLFHLDRHIRANAAFVFAGLGDPTGFDTIVAILNDKSAERTLWPPVVYRGPNTPARRSLEQQITEDRYYAVYRLGELKDSRAIVVLRFLLSDSDSTVSDAARLVIAAMEK